MNEYILAMLIILSLTTALVALIERVKRRKSYKKRLIHTADRLTKAEFELRTAAIVFNCLSKNHIGTGSRERLNEARSEYNNAIMVRNKISDELMMLIEKV